MNLRDELLAVREQHGVLTPAILREAARPKDHPLHSRVYDKAPAEAAEAYYLQRAHDLIVSVRIKLPSGDLAEGRDVRAFQAVRGTDANTFVYDPSEEVAADPLRRAIVLREMEREWKVMQSRYSMFAEFIEMVRRDLAA